MVRRDLRGESFQQSQKKSSSGLTVFLLVLLLGSLGFSIYIYQENTKIAGERITVKIKNADLSNQIEKSTAKIPPLENKIKENQYLIETLKYEYGLLDKEKADLEIINSDLEKKKNELERDLWILIDNKTKPQTLDDLPVQDPNGQSEMTLLFDSLQKDKDELSTKAAALEKIINNKSAEILDLQVQLVQSNNQIGDLSDEVTELKTQLSIPIISSSPPEPVSNLPQPVRISQIIKSCNSTKAILQKRPAPTYPRRAIQRNIEGVVKLKFDVSTSGSTTNITVVSTPNSILSSAAINAAEKIKFKPAEDCDGNFVIDREVTTNYRFSLN